MTDGGSEPESASKSDAPRREWETTAATSRRNTAHDALERLFRDGRTNAVLSWLLVDALAVAFVESALEFDRQWLVFVAAVGTVVLVPPVAYGEWCVMVPWELLVLASLPILVRSVFGGGVGAFASYLAFAGLASSSRSNSTRSRRCRSRTGSPSRSS